MVNQTERERIARQLDRAAGYGVAGSRAVAEFFVACDRAKVGLDHRPEHDFWMTHPDDVDYLAPADRWCRVCAKPDREHICTTCGRRADDPYRNPAAGEGCIDRVHDAFTDRRTGAVQA